MLLIKNITKLYGTGDGIRRGKAMQEFPSLENAFLLVENGRFSRIGKMQEWDSLSQKVTKEIDARGKSIFPAFADSHTHIIYPTDRHGEFEDKIKGLSYAEIAAKGGGILNTALKLRNFSEDTLYQSAAARLDEMVRMGTATFEIKSGYGLDTESELKMLRVANRLKAAYPGLIKTTFLGAHAVPPPYRENREAYVQLLVEEMIPQVAAEKLADYCDVFCDKGFFTPEETARILETGLKYGLKPKIHANELDFSGGIQVGTAYGAVSVDHLEFTGDAEIDALLNASTIPTLLPSTAFFLGLHYPPARKMIDAGLPVALASDYNPGSSPSGNMQFVLSLACIQLKMLPAEAWNAATINGAAALELETETGSISPGKRADFIITEAMDSEALIPYYFGKNHILETWIGGNPYSGI